MKKSAILVLSLAFAGATFFGVWSTLRTGPATPLLPDADAAVEADTHARVSNRLATPDHSSSTRLDASGSPRGVDTTVPKSRLRALRVRVAYSSGVDEHAQGIDVRAANRTGYVQDTTQVGLNEFGADELVPGPYVIAVTAAGFQRSVVRAELAAGPRETLVDVVLKPMRVVHVRWQTSAGEPIAEALAKADIDMGHIRLAVYASVAPIVEDGPSPERAALSSITMDYGLGRGDDGRRFAHRLWMNTDSTVNRAANAPEDTFGALVIDEPGRLWLSAWCGGVLIDTKPLESTQDEVVFTTRVEDMAVAQGTVSLRLYDVVQETPIAGVAIRWAEHSSKDARFPPGILVDNVLGEPAGEPAKGIVTDENGRLERQMTPGWTTLSVGAEGFANACLRIRVLSGQKLDLGLIALQRANAAVRFDVVDSQGKPVTGVAFELVRLSSYDGTDVPYDRAVSGSRDGVLAFEHLARDRYLLRCSAENTDCTPLIVEPSDITTDPSRTTARVTVGTPRWVSFVFDPPLSPGTLLMLETLDGLPVRTLETTEFGVVATWLGGTDYTLHLVEHGRPTPAVRFKVDSDPFVLEIER